MSFLSYQYRDIFSLLKLSDSSIFLWVQEVLITASLCSSRKFWLFQLCLISYKNYLYSQPLEEKMDWPLIIIKQPANNHWNSWATICSVIQVRKHEAWNLGHKLSIKNIFFSPNPNTKWSKILWWLNFSLNVLSIPFLVVIYRA